MHNMCAYLDMYLPYVFKCGKNTFQTIIVQQSSVVVQKMHKKFNNGKSFLNMNDVNLLHLNDEVWHFLSKSLMTLPLASKH